MTKTKRKLSVSTPKKNRIKSQRYREARERSRIVRTQYASDEYTRKRHPVPATVTISKKRLGKKTVRWIATDNKGRILSQKNVEKGENLASVTQKFNKKTLSFDDRLLSVVASINRNTKNGKYLVRKVQTNKDKGRRYQIMVTARCTVYPKAKLSRPIDGGFMTGYSGFLGSDEKKIRDAKNHIEYQLAKAKVKKSYEDVVVFDSVEIAYEYYRFQKSRPIGAGMF